MTLKPIFDGTAMSGVALLPALFFGRDPGSSWWVYMIFWRGRIGFKVRQR